MTSVISNSIDSRSFEVTARTTSPNSECSPSPAKTTSIESCLMAGCPVSMSSWNCALALLKTLNNRPGGSGSPYSKVRWTSGIRGLRQVRSFQGLQVSVIISVLFGLITAQGNPVETMVSVGWVDWGSQWVWPRDLRRQRIRSLEAEEKVDNE